MKAVTKMNRPFICPLLYRTLGRTIYIHFLRAAVPARPLAPSFFAAILCAFLALTGGTAPEAATAITAAPPVPAPPLSLPKPLWRNLSPAWM